MACMFSTVFGCNGISSSATFIPGGVGEIAFWDTATTLGGENVFTYDASLNTMFVERLVMNVDGTLSTPTIRPKFSDTDSGIYGVAENVWGMSSGGLENVRWTATGPIFNVNNLAAIDFSVRANPGGPGDSAFFVDAGANAVGVGETSPQAKFHVVSSTQPQIRLGSTAASNAQNSTILGIATSAADFISQTVANDTVLMAKSGGHIYFASNTAGAQVARVIFARGGNTGINNMSPNNPLVVSETSVGTAPSDSTGWTGLFHDNAAAGGIGSVGIVGGNSGSAQLYLGQTSDGDRSRIVHTASTGDLSFWTEASAKFNISSVGQFSFNMGQTRPDTTVRFELAQSTGDTVIAWRQNAETVGNSVDHLFLTGTPGSAAAATNQLGKIYAEISQANPSALQSFMAFEINSGDNNLEFMRANATGIVINEGGADYDFFMESDLATNFWRMHGNSNGFITMGEAGPSSYALKIRRNEGFQVTNSSDNNMLSVNNSAININTAFQNVDVTIGGQVTFNLFKTDASADKIGIGQGTPIALLHVTQSKAAGAIACIELDQDDTDQPFIDFDGQISANATDSISTLGTPGAISHWLQIDIEGVGKRWLAAYQDPS